MASLVRLNASLCVFLIVVSHYTCAVGENSPKPTSASEGEQMSFKGEVYRSTTPQNQWILSSYEHIARAVVLAMEDEPPYDIIKEQVKSLHDESEMSDKEILDKVLMYELPFLILGGLSLLCAILIPIIGLIFCCCRSRGRCGGKLDEGRMPHRPVKRRQGLGVSIGLCCVLMAIGVTGIILSGERLGSSVSAVRVALLDSIQDIITYKNNTIGELKQLAGPDLEAAANSINKDLENVGAFVVAPLLSEARKKAQPLIISLLRLDSALSQTRDLLENVSATVHSLVTLGQSLRAELGVVRKNLTDLKAECEQDGNVQSSGVCAEIPSGDGLVAVANFSKIPSVTEEIKNTDDVLKTNIPHEVRLGNKSLEEIPRTVKEETEPGREEISNFTLELEEICSDMISRLDDAADQSIQEMVLPAKSEIERGLGPDGPAEEYNHYRLIANWTVASITIFVVLMTFVTLICGVLGTSSSDTPSTRSDKSNCAGKTFMWCVGFFVVLSFLVNLPLGILFILGSNLTVTCKAAGDLSLLEKTIDDPSLLGYYPVSKALLGNGDIEVTISGVLRGCGDGETPWQLLKMDQKIDLENETSYEDKIPPIDEIFEKLNSSITSTTVLTDKAKKALNDTRDSGVGDIDFDSFSEQMGKPLVNTSLTGLAAELSNASARVRSPDPSFKPFSDKMDAVAQKINFIEDDILTTSSVLVNLLRQSVEEVKKTSNTTLSDVETVTREWENLELFLENDALTLANKEAKTFMARILNHVDVYLETTIRKVRYQVGDCKPIKTVYDVTTGVICEHAGSALNAFWLSLGVIAVFSVITMILCVRLAKHYRRAKRASHTPRIGMYGVPLSFFDSSSRGHSTSVPGDVTSSRWV